ncbi:MAG TPA: ABC transporter permease [Acidobacteriota bacterium]|nr:ABC transporter permease [Acidobacteriota bacterium]
MQTLVQDLVFALRLMRRWPGVSVLALLTMAVGIGANTAIFSLVDSVLLRPLDYPQPQRLYDLRLESGSVGVGPISMADFLALNEARSFDFSAYSVSSYTLTADDVVQRIVGANVDAGFFQTLATQPLKGRAFQPGEDQPGRNRVALVRSALWQDLGGGSRGLGGPIRLDGEDYQVVGLLAPGFRFPGHFQADVIVPLEVQQPPRRGPFYLRGLARLKPGRTRAAMEAELDSISRAVPQQYSDSADSRRLYHLTPLQERLMGHTRSTLLLLWGAVGLVMLIACVNVANLMLGRAATRGREMAIRTSLGAGRKRLLQQLLTESLLLALAGGVLGTALAYALLALLPSGQLLPGFPGLAPAAVDLRVLLFTLAASTACGLAFGAAPAVFLLGREKHSGLAGSGRGETEKGARLRLRSALVVSEFALALMLLLGAGLLMRSFFSLQQVDAGFSPENLLTARISLPGGGSGLFAQDSSPEEGEQRRQLLLRLTGNVQSLPGVSQAGLATGLPPNGFWFSNDFVLRERPLAEGQETHVEIVNVVDTHYFSALGLKVLGGRAFQDSDRPDGRPVAIVDEAFQRRYFPGDTAVGKHIRWGGASADSAWSEIVGVVENVRHRGLHEDFSPTWYMPLTAFSPPPTFAFLVVRTQLPPATLTPQIRSEVKKLHPEIPLSNVQTMQERLEASLGTQRFRSLLMIAFAAAALLLAAVGIYGVISYSVARRRKEVGIRMALGAERRDVFRQVLAGGLRLTLLGLVLGLAASWALSSLIADMLYQVGSFDLPTVAAVSLALLSVALAATLIPTLRATRVDPVTALREE